MGKPSLPKRDIRRIIYLRKRGYSLPEIQKITGRGYGTVYKYIKDVSILPKYKNLWESKRKSSTHKAKKDWAIADIKAKSLINKLNSRDKLIILACLYWGEGNKKDLNMINSDPALISVFVKCLKEIGIKECDLKITLRLYEDLDRRKAIVFWSKVLGISKENITNVNILRGKKTGKLLFGMCRVRATKPRDHFKFIISVINLIKKQVSKEVAVVQWIERGTPKP